MKRQRTGSHIPAVLVSFLSLWRNTRDNQLTRMKGLFWLLIWKSPRFGVCCCLDHYGRGLWQLMSVYLMAARRKRERQGGAKSPGPVPKLGAPLTQCLSCRSHLLKVLKSLPVTHAPLWPLKIQTTAFLHY